MTSGWLRDPAVAEASITDRGAAEGGEISRVRAELQVARATVDSLTVALQSNRTIGTALGLIMAEYRITTGAAFQLLTRLSQDENRKIGELAGVLVHKHCSGTTRASAPAQPIVTVSAVDKRIVAAPAALAPTALR